jgi:hypothetical protein
MLIERRRIAVVITPIYAALAANYIERFRIVEQKFLSIK